MKDQKSYPSDVKSISIDLEHESQTLRQVISVNSIVRKLFSTEDKILIYSDKMHTMKQNLLEITS